MFSLLEQWILRKKECLLNSITAEKYYRKKVEICYIMFKRF